MSKQILVLGSTGKTGKRVAQRLKKLQLPVRLGSRQGSPAFDWANAENWTEVLTGISSVYLSFQPDLAVPGAVEKIVRFTQIAKAQGVKKLVLLSGRGEREAEACEQTVMDSGMEWTIVRSSWFMQNFSESFLLDSVLSGEVVLPNIKALEPFVDADDIADVAVAALTEQNHSSKIYELTGPALLSFRSAFHEIQSALQRPIRFTEIPLDAYVAVLQSYQLPEDFISLISYLFTEVLDGRNESLTDDVEKVLRRKPSGFAAYVEKTEKTGVWKA